MKKNNLIVIKIGSSTLTDKSGKLDISNLQRLADEIAKLGKKVIIVSSGAIVSGAKHLGISTKPKTIPQKQAAAAIGQSILMRQWEKAFEKHKKQTAQVLLTRDEIENQGKYINARNCLNTLLENNIVPIINENDTVAVEEIKVGDNDTLSALVSVLIQADLLIVLTDVDGFYMKSGKGFSRLVPAIKKINKEIEAAARQTSTQLGTGGMITKIKAAKICRAANIPMAIIHGRKKGLIAKVVNGQRVGTIFS